MLSVSSATAHRAMQVLVERRMLVRRRSHGTFVGPHFDTRPNTRVRTVYGIMSAPGLDHDTVPLDAFVLGIRAQMADANVQIGFLPDRDVRAYVRELLGAAVLAGNVAGFVPVSCPRDVYRELADSGLPTVVLGTPYVDQKDIPSVDVDNYAAGLLLTKHLIDRGHRRMAVLSALEGQPGSNLFYDGVSDALTAAQLPHNALVVRVVPLELAAVAAQLGELMAMSDGPTALIARTPTMAKVLPGAYDRIGVPADRRCEIVYQNHPSVEANRLPFTCAEPRLAFRQIVGRIGEMLECLGNTGTLEEPRVVIPVDLCTHDG